MRRIGMLGLAAWALLAAGCAEEPRTPALDDEGAEDPTPYERLETTADTSEGYESEGAAPVTPVQGPEGPADVTVGGPLTATGNLRGIARNAPPGSVTISEQGAGTRVSVKIDRYTPGTTLVASLVQGTCQRPGEVVARVGEPFSIGTAGYATLTADVPIPARTVLNGRHSLRINTPGQGAPEMVLACAELPAAG